MTRIHVAFWALLLTTAAGPAFGQCFSWPPCADAQPACDPPGALITFHGVWPNSCRTVPTGHTVEPGRIEVTLEANCGFCLQVLTDYSVTESVAAPPGTYDVYVRRTMCGDVVGVPQLVTSVQITCGGCTGDLDGDHDVDLSDLTRLLAHFGTASGATADQGDLNGDGDVDLEDLTAFLSHFGSACS